VWVLGGGGVAGIAWQIGLLAGLADEGVTVPADAVLIGTSAGAVTAANLASGRALGELYDRQLAPVPYASSGALSLGSLLRLAGAQLGARGPEHAAARIGRLALAATTRDPAEVRANIEARLPEHEWPAADLRVTAVDVATGELRVFTREDGVALVDAVGASCAVPLSVAPIQIAGRRYMDGGMRSTLNLDLAPGSGPVVALAPSNAAIGPWARISRQRAALGSERRVELVHRDPASRRAQGRSVSDPAVIPGLAAAGRAQGRLEAARLGA